MPKTIYINNTDLTREKRSSYLTEDVIATSTTIRVQSILGFEGMSTSSGQIICIGEIGNERTELVRSSVTSGYNPSQSYKEVTFRDSMIFDHPQDTKVYIIDWNRVNVQWASTVTGTKSTLFAYPSYIQPDQNETSINDTSQTSGYYFVRFNETVGDTNSDWSDAVPYGGYDDNTVFAIKKRAIDELGEEIDGKVITHEFLNQCLWEARREYHQAPGKRPFRRRFNVDIGNALTGSFRIELPSDVEKPFSAENIYGVRIGTQPNMRYYDKKEWDFDYRNKPHSTLAHAYTAGTSTSIWLTNGRDFSSSAVISVEGENISLTRIAGLSGESFQNTFRIYAHPTTAWDASIGSDVFENITLGLPDKFTVFAEPAGSAYIYFNRPIETAYVNQNIYSDYYRTLVGYDSDADVLDEPEYDKFVYYLKAMIKARRARGNYDITQDSDYKIWLAKNGVSLTSEHIGAEITLLPDIEHLS